MLLKVSKSITRSRLVGARCLTYKSTAPTNSPMGSYQLKENEVGGEEKVVLVRSSVNTVRENYRLVEPKFKKYSYATTKNYDMHLLCDTVGDRVSTMAVERPGDVAYKFGLTQTTFTFKDLNDRTKEIAQNLLNLGFVKGDRLAVILPNCPELVLNLMAAASIGVTVVLMNPAYQLVEIEYMLKKTQSKGVVILDNFKTLKHYEILTRIVPELNSTPRGELKSTKLPDLKHVILVNNHLINDKSSDYKGTWSFTNELLKFDGAHKPSPSVDFDDPFVMLFTSGTTGFPKAAVLSHFNLINSAYLDVFVNGLVDASRVIACPIPIFHIFGLIGGVLEPLLIGGKTIFPHLLPDTLSLMKAVHAEKCTAIKGAPVIFNDLINHPERSKFDLSSLQYALLGASFIPRTLMENIRDELKIKHVLQGYGQTECSAAGTITRVGMEDKYAFESIGQPLPYTEVKIIDSEKNVVPVNVDGEICVRGYNVMKGYWDEPAKTAETIDRNGWLHTGDIGSMDEHGRVFYKTRAKEVIIRGGVNIYPAEIENFMRAHGEIVDAYCFGITVERIGEEVCCWIKLKKDSKLTTNDIIEYCKGKVAYFKVPKYIKFVEAFPMNANGKVQKFKMVDQMKKELQL